MLRKYQAYIVSAAGGLQRKPLDQGSEPLDHINKELLYVYDYMFKVFQNITFEM